MSRVSVFYDGHWFSRVADHVASSHSRLNARLSLHGLHAAFRWYLSPGEPDRAELVEIHYVRGRPASASGRSAWDRVLAQAEVVRHDVPIEAGKELGADVELALTVAETVRAHALNVVILVTGDGDFAPLVSRLTGEGVRVVVPRMAAERVSGGDMLSTSRHLSAAGAETPLLDDLLAATQQPGYSGPPLFLAQPGGVPTPAQAERTGVITRWEPGATHGFITDPQNVSWFVSQDETGGQGRLPAGTRVTFAGRSRPLPGKKYPYARRVRLAVEQSLRASHDPDC
ncbi:NYN domain-containing protein [Actinomadura geliboluensis]|uniref:NYN domain-containing protein n=1 Tax=Actinomadura geliboluensis TaxID=882440 RepID=UPI003722FCD6